MFHLCRQCRSTESIEISYRVCQEFIARILKPTMGVSRRSVNGLIREPRAASAARITRTEIPMMLLYLFLCIVGAVLPWSQLGPRSMGCGLNTGLL